MPIKQRNAVSRSDFEEALDYLGSSVSEVAKATNIPRGYLSDLKNRNVRLRREHEEKLRSFLEDAGVEFEAADPPRRNVAPGRLESPHPAVEVAPLLRRSLALDDTLEDTAIADALEAQADRDARLSELFALPVKYRNGLEAMFGETVISGDSKKTIEEARRLLAESYLLVGILRGLRGFKAAKSDVEPQTIGDLLMQESDAVLEEAGLVVQPSAPDENDTERKETAPA